MNKTEKILARVVPNAKRNDIKKEETGLKVYLTAPPVQGKANKLCIKLLAEYFNCPKAEIKILKGKNSRNKVIEVRKCKDRKQKKHREHRKKIKAQSEKQKGK